MSIMPNPSVVALTDLLSTGVLTANGPNIRQKRPTNVGRVRIDDMNLSDVIPCVTLEQLLQAAGEDSGKATGNERGDHIEGYTVVVSATIAVEVEMPYDTFLRAQTIRRLQGKA